MEGEPQRLGFLAEVRIGSGDAEGALEAAAEGIETARAQGNVQGELAASLARPGSCSRAHGPDARAEIRSALARTLEMAGQTDAKSYVPQVHVELAELARQSGDEKGWQDELGEAHRMFSEIGATGIADRMASQLAISST